jgi:initiation factor 1A
MVRTAQGPYEMYAVVQKRLGNGWVDVKCIDGVSRKCNIPKKFTGKKKELILVDTWLLVGLREFETHKLKCDVLEVYNAHEIMSLQTMDGQWHRLTGEKETPYIPEIETGTVHVTLDTNINIDDI